MVDDASPDSPTRRLWTPWRMRYVGGGAAESGCIFCNRFAADDDVRSLILYRGPRCFAILNLFPYNTAHLMVVPNAHVDSPERTDPAGLAEMSALLGPLLSALRRAFNPDGFNIGMNVGAIAGAGVADHLHQHIVPRWRGDANFMPIIASTMVLPELIPISYAKIRAELNREPALGSTDRETTLSVPVVVLTGDRNRVVMTNDNRGWRLPAIAIAPGEAIWPAVAMALSDRGIPAALAGWAGPTRADDRSSTALTVVLDAATEPPGEDLHSIVDASSYIEDSEDRLVLQRALIHLAPAM